MKKYLVTFTAAIALFLISNNVSAQSTLIIENPDTLPVPVKIVNMQPAGKSTTPFTQQSMSLQGTGYGRVKIEAAAGETKVIQFVMGYSVSGNMIKIVNAGRTYRLPLSMIGASNGTYSGALNIVVNSNTSVDFQFEISGTGGEPAGERFILVSGYTLK